jgi:threonine/homoserine/homoserine lactone efflux protein
MAYLAFTSFIIGFSGALVPGPVFVAVVSQAIRRGVTAGPLAVVGHATLETVTVGLLWLGLRMFLASWWMKSIVGAFGGTFLVWSGFELLRFARQASIQESLRQASAALVRHGPIVVGLVTSAINPYYYFWWATVGNDFMLRGFEVAGTIGVGIFLFSHWMSDLTWYTFVSASIHGGKKLITDKVYRTILRACGMFLVGIGVIFLADAIPYLIRAAGEVV